MPDNSGLVWFVFGPVALAEWAKNELYDSLIIVMQQASRKTEKDCYER